MKKLVCLGLIAALAGCGNLQDVNDSLKKLNASLAGGHASTMQVGDVGSYRPTITVAAPAGVCDSGAFGEGAKVGYVNSWNQLVRDRATLFKVKAQNSPGDRAAASNSALWSDKMIATSGLAHESDYTTLVGVAANNCKSNSFLEGKTAGQDAGLKDFHAMQAREAT